MEKPLTADLASSVAIQHAPQHHSSSSGSMRVGCSQSANKLAAKGAVAYTNSNPQQVVSRLKAPTAACQVHVNRVQKKELTSCSNDLHSFTR